MYWMLGQAELKDFLKHSPLSLSFLFVMIPIDTANQIESTADARVILYLRLYNGYINRLLSIIFVLSIFDSSAKIALLTLCCYKWNYINVEQIELVVTG